MVDDQLKLFPERHVNCDMHLLFQSWIFLGAGLPIRFIVLVSEGTHLQKWYKCRIQKQHCKSCFAFLFSLWVDVVAGKHNKILLIVKSLGKGLKSLSSLAAMLTCDSRHTVRPRALALVQMYFAGVMHSSEYVWCIVSLCVVSAQSHFYSKV